MYTRYVCETFGLGKKRNRYLNMYNIILLPTICIHHVILLYFPPPHPQHPPPHHPLFNWPPSETGLLIPSNVNRRKWVTSMRLNTGVLALLRFSIQVPQGEAQCWRGEGGREGRKGGEGGRVVAHQKTLHRGGEHCCQGTGREVGTALR